MIVSVVLQKEAAKIRGGTADVEADRTFVREVRELVAQLKRLARQMEQHLHQAGDSRADKDLNQAGQKLADIEKNLSEMTGCVQL